MRAPDEDTVDGSDVSSTKSSIFGLELLLEFSIC